MCAVALLVLGISTQGISQPPLVWQPVGLPREGLQNATSVSDAERVESAGRHGIWVTARGGKGWVGRTDRTRLVPISYPSGVLVDELAFLDSDTAYAVGAASGKGAWIASTADGGMNWQPAQGLPRSGPGGFAGFADVQFFDRAFGISVGGGNFGEGGRILIAVTHDGGASWKFQRFATDDPNSVLSRVRFKSRSVVWAVGGESIYSSRDGGISWQLSHREPAATALSGLAVVQDSGIFVTGGWGLVLRSRDSGATWERLKVPPGIEHRYLCSLDFADARRGWVGGDNGTIIGTTDGGQTWQQEETGIHGLLRDLVVVDGYVYAADDDFFLLRRDL